MTISEKAIRAILNDFAFKQELKAFCESVINDELSKPDAEMNCDLIDECTAVILELDAEDGDNAAMLIPFISSTALIERASKSGFASLSRGARAAIVAAVAATLLISTNAAIAAMTGVNLLSNLGDTVYEALEDWGIIKNDDDYDDDGTELFSTQEIEMDNDASYDSEDKEKTELKPSPAYAERRSAAVAAEANSEHLLTSIKLGFTDGFKSSYYWGESLSLNGITVTAYYSDGSNEQLSIYDCDVSGYNKALVGTQKILVEYGGASASFEITLTKTETAEKIITGVEGTAPKKQVYTTEDTSVDLSGIKVRLIYSDGSFSQYYYENAAVVTKAPDFSVTGEQQVTVRIANRADYVFTVLVQDVFADPEIRGISLNSDDYTFEVGESLAYHDFYVRVSFVDKNRPDEYLYYPEDEKLFELINLDTSVETANEKYFTVVYKGHYVTAPYSVRGKQTIAYTSWHGGEPKFVYYQGEPLGYSYGSDGKAVIAGLASSKAELNNSSITLGDDWSLDVYYYESDHTEPVNLQPSRFNYVGYDPDKLGFQTVELFFNGSYVTSYLIYVYGDGTYCPSNRVADVVTYGFEGEALQNDHFEKWYLCTGNGVIEKEAAHSTLGAKCYLSDGAELGKARAYALLSNGERYAYDVNYVREIKKVTLKNWDRWHFIKLDDISGYDFGDDSITVTYEDGYTQTLSPKALGLACTYNGGTLQPITEKTGINSGFGFINFVFDRTKYSNIAAVYNDSANAYFYRSGYEDTIQLVIEEHSSDFRFTYGKNFYENGFRNANSIYLSSYDNVIPLPQSKIKISGVEWTTPGVYEAVISADYEGLHFETRQRIKIVEQAYEPSIFARYDPYQLLTPATGKELDMSRTVLCFVDREGNMTEILPGEFTYEIIEGGSGHMIDEEPENNKISVRYAYTSPEGFNYSVVYEYNTGFYVNNIMFDYSPDDEAIIVTFDEVEEADYYIIDMLGKTFKTEEPIFYCREGFKKNMVFVNPIVTVTAVKFVDGKEVTSTSRATVDRLEIK